MTTLAIHSSDSFFDRLETPTAGQQGKFIRTSILSELRRMRFEGARTSWAFNDLESLAHEHGVSVQTSALFSKAQQLLLVIPGDIAPPELDVDADGDVLFDWSGAGGRMMTIALRKDGRISYAARLSSTKTRNGNDFFLDAIPVEIIDLVRAVTRH